MFSLYEYLFRNVLQRRSRKYNLKEQRDAVRKRVRKREREWERERERERERQEREIHSSKEGDRYKLINI